jgi:hypothetical protein
MTDIIIVAALLCLLALWVIALVRMEALTWWILNTTFEWRYFPCNRWQRAFQRVWRILINDDRV